MFVKMTLMHKEQDITKFKIKILSLTKFFFSINFKYSTVLIFEVIYILLCK